MSTVLPAVLMLAGAHAEKVSAAEDIEFVAEHLPEVAMDNRFATLPVWSSAGDATRSSSFAGQAGYARTSTGSLDMDGSMWAAAANRKLSRRWSAGAFVFYDRLNLSGNGDRRPLQTLFSPGTPIFRPVMAGFDGLDGTVRHYGGGIRLSMASSRGWLGEHHWVGGLLWQRVELRDYRLTYRLLEGPEAGVSGQIDFDNDYSHVTPFVGLELPHVGTVWSITPHVLAAVPFPRRGVVGHITGPGFDLRGDTEDAGEGKHFGDPSLTFGLDLTYLPAHFTVDIGTMLTQRLLEPVSKKGIDSNWVLSGQWRF